MDLTRGDLKKIKDYLTLQLSCEGLGQGSICLLSWDLGS